MVNKMKKIMNFFFIMGVLITLLNFLTPLKATAAENIEESPIVVTTLEAGKIMEDNTATVSVHFLNPNNQSFTLEKQLATFKIENGEFVASNDKNVTLTADELKYLASSEYMDFTFTIKATGDQPVIISGTSSTIYLNEEDNLATYNSTVNSVNIPLPEKNVESTMKMNLTVADKISSDNSATINAAYSGFDEINSTFEKQNTVLKIENGEFVDSSAEGVEILPNQLTYFSENDYSDFSFRVKATGSQPIIITGNLGVIYLDSTGSQAVSNYSIPALNIPLKTEDTGTSTTDTSTDDTSTTPTNTSSDTTNTRSSEANMDSTITSFSDTSTEAQEMDTLETSTVSKVNSMDSDSKNASKKTYPKTGDTNNYLVVLVGIVLVLFAGGYFWKKQNKYKY